MDPQSAKQVRDAIVELQADKRTIILTTHNLNEAEILADCIAVIRHGRIIAQGTFAELSQRFVGNPVMEIAFTKPLNGVASDLAGMVEIIESGEDWLGYRTAEPRSVNPAVLSKIAGHGCESVNVTQGK